MTRNKKNLDRYLVLALDHLKKQWLNPKVGFVSCVLVDKGRLVLATNTLLSSGKLRHAEHNAISIFEKLYGPLSTNAIAIITLSPCVIYSQSRYGPPCAEILLRKGVKRIHFGLLHDRQGTLNTYIKLGFSATITENLKIRKVCIGLLSLFVENKKLIMVDKNSWTRIKAGVKDKIFDYKN